LTEAGITGKLGGDSSGVLRFNMKSVNFFLRSGRLRKLNHCL
jgi:hypothetical protein